MKLRITLTLCLCLLAGRASVAEPAATFHNPILPGFYPDPSICRAGDDYYLVNSTFEYFPGVPVFHSRDLVNWEQIGYVLTRTSQLSLEKVGASGGIYAPTLRYHDGVFYMVTTDIGRVGNFYCTATDPAGPWSEPHRLDRTGMDPSLLFDDDGKVYYTRHSGGERGFVATQELDIKTGKLIGEQKEIWRGTGGVWPEGPHLYKIAGRYYLMIAEGGTGYEHSVTIARSDSPWGPYEACPHNPILTHRDQKDRPIQALGHADFVETPAGWWAVCLGIRPQDVKFHHLGRETLLAPVSWSDGWPTIGNEGRIDVEMPAPKLASHPWPAPPKRDEFDGDKLALPWNFLRNPREADWSLAARPGFLRLCGSSVALGEQNSPAFVGRRQTALACNASARMSFSPINDGAEAGLVIRGNDKNYVALGVTRHEGKKAAFLRQVVDGAAVEPLRYTPLTDGPLTLSIDAELLGYKFHCKAEGGEALDLGTVATKDLSSERIGGFTGVYFGMYAVGGGAEAPADFDWFDYEVRTP